MQRQQQEEQQRLRSLEEVKRNQHAPVTIERQKPTPAEASIRIAIRRVSVEGSKVVEPEAIRAVVAPLEGRTVSYQEILDAVEALNELYRTRHLVGLAFLPPQRITDGTLRITMLDSRFGRLEVDGARNTDPAFVRSFIRLEPGGVVSVQTLSDDVERLRATTDLGATIDLKPGDKSGDVDAKLTVVEPPRSWAVTAGTDNFGAYPTGRLRALAGFSVASLTGRRDALSLDTTYSQGLQLGMFSYESPVGSWGTKIRAEGSAAQSEVVQGAASELDIKAQSKFGRATVSQLITAQPGFRLFASVAEQARRGFTILSGTEVGREDYRAWAPALDAIAAFRPAAAFIRISETSGRNNEAADSSSFRKTTLDALISVSLPESINLQLRSAAQYSPMDGPLPISERFSLGGFYRMRAYPVDYLTGVQGYYGAAELGRAFTLSLGSWTMQARPYALVEYGGIQDPVINPLRGRVASSAGGGVDFVLDRGTVRLAVATPLMKTQYEEDHPGTTFYFSFAATLP